MIEGKARLALRDIGFFPGTKAPACLQFDADLADIAAVKALNRGDATADQQKRALDWIVKQLAAIQTTTFQPDNPHATAFAEGRRFVGLKLAFAVQLSTRELQHTGA